MSGRRRAWVACVCSGLVCLVTAGVGLGIGSRHVTISTVGVPVKIRRLADLRKQYHLAVSLHAPNEALRTKIVPTNDKTGLEAILAAADYFFEKTGRQEACPGAPFWQTMHP